MARSSYFVGAIFLACLASSACSDRGGPPEGTPVILPTIRTTLDSNGDIRIDGQVVDRQDIRDHFERLHDEYPDRPVAFSSELWITEYRFVIDAAALSGYRIAVRVGEGE
jgi:hypothetical protein